MMRDMGEAVSLLERPVYRYRQVDRLLALPGGTTRRWLNGYRRKQVDYPPFLRTQPSNTEWVTWGEFVETRLFAGYRRIDEIPAPQLRTVIERLRELFDSKYPLAYAAPYTEVDGKRFLVRAQEDADLPIFLEMQTGQYVLRPWVEEFRQNVQFTEESPHYVESITADAEFPLIRWDPRLRGGEPVIDDRSIRVETVASLVESGEQVEDVADWYDLETEQVRQAVGYGRVHEFGA